MQRDSRPHKQDERNLKIRGACQNNLKNLDIDIPANELTVVTGVSGSGKSSLAFDTIYAEGQRRYVETFSPYARLFLDRMDRPKVKSISGVPPAIAIDQVNPVKTTRSTVGTMTELNDHLKQLFAHCAALFCPECGAKVEKLSIDDICDQIQEQFGENAASPPFILVMFPLAIPERVPTELAREHLKRKGYERIASRKGDVAQIVQDRLRPTASNRSRLAEAVEAALRTGRQVFVQRLDADRSPSGRLFGYSDQLRCMNCDIAYARPKHDGFSFNSPVGACGTCRGFGRVMGIDYSLVIPDESLSLSQGAVRTFNTQAQSKSRTDLLHCAADRNIPTDVPWSDLSQAHKEWVINGDERFSGDWSGHVWYGVRRFFEWQESRKHNMHIRVYLSRYRSYAECPDCLGARLNPEALRWRILGAVPDGVAKRRPPSFNMSEAAFARLPGLSLHEVSTMPIAACREFFRAFSGLKLADEAAKTVLDEINSRLRYLVEVGLGYLTLDRQSRTLSGGEVQRINLTTALGTTLVNALFVLDEPTIGLHARDVKRIVEILRRLRDAGNSLLVVDHDEQIIRAAERVLDIGPGPGESGGEIVHFGTFGELLESSGSATGKCLRDGDYMPELKRREVGEEAPMIEVTGARQNNLANLDVSVPMGRLVCVTGVSGSGKSTLVEDILYRGCLRRLGKPVAAPGTFDDLRLAILPDDAVMVDQSPIGKSARSNPLTYIGALGPIRNRLAAEPLARMRGYSPGHFSFNSSLGRCPECGGTGFEHLEMQFLSDVYLRCAACDGGRYRSEICDVKCHPAAGFDGDGKSIVEIMDLTVSEAAAFFSDDAKIVDSFSPLLDVGLEYLKLGQPVPTLSGGEAQRLKLATHIAKSRKHSEGPAASPHIVYFFDEPTTGLHFLDVAKLLSALRKLVDAGHSVIVIEHNLDLISSSDWMIDLGPEGGSAGGELVAQGTPGSVAESGIGHTADALRSYFDQAPGASTSGQELNLPAHGGSPEISIRNAREHNLKNVNVEIPHGRITAVTGKSGSGKSTLAFDILFKEGQRRYLETLNAYTRQFVQPASRADFDAIYGIPPTVAIEQRTSRGGRGSTVATLTEIYHFMRLLFARFGVQHCPDCGVAVASRSIDEIMERLVNAHRGSSVMILVPLVVARKGYYSEIAQWAAKKGVDQLLVDGQWQSTHDWPRLNRYVEHDIDMPIRNLNLKECGSRELREALERAVEISGGYFKVREAAAGAGEEIYSTARECPECGAAFQELDPRQFSFNSPIGRCRACFGTGMEPSADDAKPAGMADDAVCQACQGGRLNPASLAVRLNGDSIGAVSKLTISDAKDYFANLDLGARLREAARDVLSEMATRLEFLESVGLSYLSLDRAAPTLSGGEAQRIRLASQLGSGLCGACYVLDEPTIGLHVRDNRLLLRALNSLKEKGNTVVIVEHDEETMAAADHIIDLGPGGGARGGQVVAAGSFHAIQANANSVTGRMLAAPLRHPFPRNRPAPDPQRSLQVIRGKLHNLKNVNAKVPARSLVCITGVSGSGKSTLARNVIYDNMRRLFLDARSKTGGRGRSRDCRELKGCDMFARALEVDQAPIGKTPRSCPATYVNVWGTIRKLFAESTEARVRGYSAGRFSFNLPEGRCTKCAGQGEKKIVMSFLPDVRVLCESCAGARFSPETLSVTFRGKNVAEVLDMSMEEAADFFAFAPSLQRVFGLLVDVGLGYLRLGQPSPTLSGGEAQRIKLVAELAKALSASSAAARPRRSATLYILDEPTVGLHADDIDNLIRVVHALVDAGNTVVVVEHNLDFIAEADWIIDLGPEGGDGGGRIVAQGPLAKVMKSKVSATAEALRDFLSDDRRRASPNEAASP